MAPLPSGTGAIPVLGIRIQLLSFFLGLPGSAGSYLQIRQDAEGNRSQNKDKHFSWFHKHSSFVTWHAPLRVKFGFCSAFLDLRSQTRRRSVAQNTRFSRLPTLR